jgi:hypothetical protein
MLREISETRHGSGNRNSGDISPALGGDYPGNFAYSSIHSLASNVTGITVPLSGHWIPEEQPIVQLSKFFQNSTNEAK